MGSKVEIGALQLLVEAYRLSIDLPLVFCSLFTGILFALDFLFTDAHGLSLVILVVLLLVYIVVYLASLGYLLMFVMVFICALLIPTGLLFVFTQISIGHPQCFLVLC